MGSEGGLGRKGTVVIAIIAIATFAGCVDGNGEELAPGLPAPTASSPGPAPGPDASPIENVQADGSFSIGNCTGEIMLATVPFATVRQQVPPAYGIYNLFGLEAAANAEIDVRNCETGIVRGTPIGPFTLGLVGIAVGLESEEQPGPPRRFVLEVWSSSAEVSAFFQDAGLGTPFAANATMSSVRLDDERFRATARLTDAAGDAYSWDAIVDKPRSNYTWNTTYHFDADPEAPALDELGSEGIHSVQIYGGTVNFRPDTAVGDLWAGGTRAAGDAASVRQLSSRFVLTSGPAVDDG